MVAGSVLPPRMELANEDLLRAHVHSMLLYEAKISLWSSMVDVLDMSGEKPTLAVNESIAYALRDPAILAQTRVSAERVLDSLKPQLETVDWYTDRWLGGCTQPGLYQLRPRLRAVEGPVQISQRTGG